MSEYIKSRANNHKVKHLFSRKSHYFEVLSDSGNKHNVIIKLGCDCRYMGVQGIANGDICSHILAALKSISTNGNIKNLNQDDISLQKINYCSKPRSIYERSKTKHELCKLSEIACNKWKDCRKHLYKDDSATSVRYTDI